MSNTRPLHSSSTNKEKQNIKQVHKYLIEEVQKIKPADDAAPELKTLFSQFIELIESLKG